QVWKRDRAWAFAALPAFLAVGLFGWMPVALAQTPPPTQQPLPASDGNIALSSPSTTLENGTRFLRRLATEAARAAGAPSQFTPSGGGADLEAAPQTVSAIDNRYR